MRSLPEDWDIIARNAWGSQNTLFAYTSKEPRKFVIALSRGFNRYGGDFPWSSARNGWYLVSIENVGAAFYDLEDLDSVEEKHRELFDLHTRLDFNLDDYEDEALEISELLWELRKRLSQRRREGK
jgi:hypothetical protein